MARESTKLTKRAIDLLEYEGREYTNASGRKVATRDVQWDTLVRGLGARIFPSGRKAFVLSYRTKGGTNQKRMIQLGEYGRNGLTLDQARRAAITHLGKMADAEARGDEPYDPLTERETLAKAETVGEMCDAYKKRHVPLKKTGHEDERRIRTYILPAWSNRKLKSIHRTDVASLHSKIGREKPYEANRVLALMSVLFAKAEEWGALPEGHPNPTRSVQPFREEKRDRWVKPSELPLLAEAIDDVSDPYARGVLWCYLLTGARKNELLRLRWDEVDLDRREIRLRAKGDRIHYIPLSDEAVEVLKSLPREAKNPHVFVGREPGQHLVNIAKTWRRVRERATQKLWSRDPDVKAVMQHLTKTLEREPRCSEVREAVDGSLPAGMEDIRLHDLRRTVGSWLARSGACLPLIGKVLGHTQPSTTAIYARLAEDPARKALEDHGKQLMETARKKQESAP